MQNSLKYIDTHCHLDMSSYVDDLHEVLLRADLAGTIHTISIGIDLESSKQAVLLAKKYSQISATVGIHPHDVSNIEDTTYQQISDLVHNNRDVIVGYGEIGLDYFKNYAPISLQKEHFYKQLDLAKELELPIIIHDRDAHEDVLTAIKDMGPFENGGVMHCFSGDYGFARQVLDLGFHISIPGIVTFKNAHDLHEVASKVPLESMLLETDGPFLSPHPHRGKRNEPSYIPIISKAIAALKNIDEAEIAKATTKNAVELFKLKNTIAGENK